MGQENKEHRLCEEIALKVLDNYKPLQNNKRPAQVWPFSKYDHIPWVTKYINYFSLEKVLPFLSL